MWYERNDKVLIGQGSQTFGGETGRLTAPAGGCETPRSCMALIAVAGACHGMQEDDRWSPVKECPDHGKCKIEPATHGIGSGCKAHSVGVIP